ncbi:MAG: sigma-70 family RNA polymerase sigma factor [Candidatus Hydrogenedentales bacterium]|jgi:RNA polymerase sigma factor (sigma-70 family)
METAWVLAARAGDREAFARLVASHFRVVYAVAFSTVGRWDDAEDVAQETFLVAWKNITGLRSPEAFGGWLCRIARNLAQNWRRSGEYRQALLKRHRQRQDTALRGSLSVERLRDEERRSEVWKALETLSLPLRQAVVLYYLEGQSTVEAARILNIPEATFRKRLEYARPKLRAYFESQWQAEMERERQRLNPGQAAERILSGLAVGPLAASLHAAGSFGVWGWACGIWSAHAASLVAGTGAAALALVAATAWTLLSWHSPAATSVTTQAGKMTNGLIRGRVTDGADRPVPGAKITAYVTGALPPPEPASRFSSKSYRADSGTEGASPPDVPEPSAISWGVANFVSSPERVRYVDAVNAVLSDPSRWRTIQCDTNGTFEFRDLPANGAVIVQASALDCCLAGATVVLAPGRLTQDVALTLLPGVTIDGVVLDPSGVPVPGARVQRTALATAEGHAGGASGNASGGHPLDWGWVFSDSSGRFHMTLEEYGLLAVQVVTPNARIATLAGIRLDPGVLLELRLPRPAALRGQVLDIDGKPVAGVTVVLLSHPEQSMKSDSTAGAATGAVGRIGFSQVAAHTVTSATGSFQFEGLDTSPRFTVDLYDENGAALATTLDLPRFEPEKTLSWTHILQEPGKARGTVQGSQREHTIFRKTGDVS